MKNVAFTFNSESLKLFLQAEIGELVNEGLRRSAIDQFYFSFRMRPQMKNVTKILTHSWVAMDSRRV